MWIFLINSQSQISLTIIDNQNFKRYPNSAASQHHHFFQKFCSDFYLFQVEWKQKMLQISEITEHFQKCCSDYDRGTRALQKNVLGDKIRVTSQLSVPFWSGKWVAWKKVKISNISGTMPSIFFSPSPCVWENNGLSNKN